MLLGLGGWRLAQYWRTLPVQRKWLMFAALALAEIAVWLCLYGFVIEPRSLMVRRVEIVSATWHGAPLHIAAIGDTHVGGLHVNAARMGRIVQRINALRPDLVVLLGDYAAGHAPEAERAPAEQQEILGGVATFAALNARYGVVAALGNHDDWYGRQSISSALENAGVAVLWNRHVLIRTSTTPIVIAGLADEWTGEPNLTEALDGAPMGADTIVIAHNPDSFAAAPRGAALFLASHTHCGQVTVPLLGRPILPVRFLNPPEITLITIRSGAPNYMPPPPT